MVLLRGFIHLLALVALGLVALAFGRWLRDPAGVGAFALLLVSVVVVAVCLVRLYGRDGLVPLRPRPAPWPGEADRVASEPRGPLVVDLNRATRAELMSLPGVGPVAAARIEEARPLRSVGDLARVPGFGPARLRALADLVKI